MLSEASQWEEVALGLASSRGLHCFTLVPLSLRAGTKAIGEH